MAKDLNQQTVKIKTAQACTARNGSQYFKLTIQDKDGENHNAMIWDCCNAHEIGINNEIEIGCTYDSTYKNYTINGFILKKEGRLGLSEFERVSLFKDVLSHVMVENWIDSSEISDKSKKMFDSISTFWLDNQQLIEVSPAAINHHHNFVGGLLQHTSELIEFIYQVVYRTDTVFKDDILALCTAGALMHDMGKIYEYSIDTETGIIEYKEDFKKSLYLDKDEKIYPHILWGYNWALEKGFPELAHIIGSHHNTTEHGAIFKPTTPEASLVYMADYFSSRFGKISVDDLPTPEEKLIKETVDGQVRRKEVLDEVIREDEIPF